jgi:hypothetical protein
LMDFLLFNCCGGKRCTPDTSTTTSASFT